MRRDNYARSVISSGSHFDNLEGTGISNNLRVLDEGYLDEDPRSDQLYRVSARQATDIKLLGMAERNPYEDIDYAPLQAARS